MKDIRYSKEIANAVRTFLEEDGWHFYFHEEAGIFQFDLSMGEKIKRISYLLRVREDDYLVYAYSPVGADSDNREEMIRMTEFICRVNYGLCDGNFELNMNNGEIRYKTYVNCEGGIVPGEPIIRESIYCCAVMFNRYASGILSIVFGDASAEDATDECEISLDEVFRCLLRKKNEQNAAESVPETISALLQ